MLTSNPERDVNFSSQEFLVILEQLSHLLKQIGENQGNGERIQPENPQPFSMNDSFLSSVKMGAKPGMKLE